MDHTVFSLRLLLMLVKLGRLLQSKDTETIYI